MAIKGKGRTKSKPAARAPRAQPVQVKPPLFRRPWMIALVSFLVGMGVVWVAVWATNGLRENDRDAARTANAEEVRTVVRQWANTVDATIGQIQDAAPGSGQVVVFTPLTTTLDALAKNEDAKDAADIAKTAQDQTQAAITALSDVDLPGVIRGHDLDVATANYLLNSKARMVAGLELYARVAALVREAATTGDPDVADALIEEATQLAPLAKQTFDQGYADYAQANPTVLAPAGATTATGG